MALDDCGNENSLPSLADEFGQSAYIKEGFLPPKAQDDEYGIVDVGWVLQLLSNVIYRRIRYFRKNNDEHEWDGWVREGILEGGLSRSQRTRSQKQVSSWTAKVKVFLECECQQSILYIENFQTAESNE